MTCVAHLKIPEPSCPYSVPMRDSVHLRKCELRVGICQEAYWRLTYHLCLTFVDGEAELKKKKKETEYISRTLMKECGCYPKSLAELAEACKKPVNNKLPEPSLAKTMQLIDRLEKAGIMVYRKTLRERWNE